MEPRTASKGAPMPIARSVPRHWARALRSDGRHRAMSLAAVQPRLGACRRWLGFRPATPRRLSGRAGGSRSTPGWTAPRAGAEHLREAFQLHEAEGSRTLDLLNAISPQPRASRSRARTSAQNSSPSSSAQVGPTERVCAAALRQNADSSLIGHRLPRSRREPATGRVRFVE